MKVLTLPAVLAAALFSVVVLLPFIAGSKPELTGNRSLELTMTSTRPGFVQIYFRDATGVMSEATSSKQPLVQSNTPRKYRLPLPVGTLHQLRLDPVNRIASVAFHSLQIVDLRGNVVRRIPFSHVKAAQQIGSIEEQDDLLQIATTPTGSDPQLTLMLDPPVEVSPNHLGSTARFVVAGLGIFAALVVVLWSCDRARFRRKLIVVASWVNVHPNRAIAAMAAVAVIASAYPVVFLGRSHVSPNVGLPLLYDDVPTLPDATSTVSIDPHGSDIGAMLLAHLPYSVVEHRAAAGGEFPLWNRYNSSGAPLLGQGQSMIGDPLHVGVILANGAAWAWDLKFLVAKWLFALGLGLLVLGVTAHLPAAALVTVAAPFIGFFLYRLNHPAYFSLCYAPWPLYCWWRLTQAHQRRAITGAAAGLLLSNLALMNSGTVKEAYMLLLTMNAAGASLLIASTAPWRARVVKLAVASWTGLILVLLTAPIWATFLHTLANAQTNYDAAVAYQIQPSLLLGAFDEAFFRLIMPEEAVFNPALNFLLLLGLLYFVATLRTHRNERAVVALALFSLAPFALVFGLVPSAWIAALPLIGRVQHIDNTFLCALIVLWSVLAGAGFARAAVRLGGPKGRADLFTLGAWLAGIVGGWIAFRQTVHRGAFGPGMTFSVLQPGQVLPVSGFVWGYLAALLVASGVGLWLMRRSLRRGRFTSAGAIMLALCTIVLLWRNGQHAEAVGFEKHVLKPPPRADLHASSPAMEYVRIAQAEAPGRGFGFYGNVFPGWTTLYGLEGISGPDALMNPWYRELIALSGVQRGISWDFSLPPENLGEVQPLFDALNVRFYFSRGLDDEVLGRSLQSVQVLDLNVWESPTVWPRAFFTDRVMVYDRAEELVETIKHGDRRPFAAVSAAGSGPVRELRHDLSGRTVVAATNYRLTENTTAFDVHASGPGVIVLTETYWPGDFRAEINGQKTAILRLNHAFKGVAVNAAGDYHLSFRYVPRNFPRNLLLSATGVLLGLFSFMIANRGRTPVTEPRSSVSN